MDLAGSGGRRQTKASGFDDVSKKCRHHEALRDASAVVAESSTADASSKSLLCSPVSVAGPPTDGMLSSSSASRTRLLQ